MNDWIYWAKYKFDLNYKKITFMTTFNKKLFSKLVMGIAVLSMATIYSCNDTGTTEVKTDSVLTPVTPLTTDTMMRMHKDSMVTDTSKKGGQPTPVGDN